jgi:hypothetical protein
MCECLIIFFQFCDVAKVLIIPKNIFQKHLLQNYIWSFLKGKSFYNWLHPRIYYKDVAICIYFFSNFGKFGLCFFIRNPLCKIKSEFFGESIVKTCSPKKKVCANHHFFGANFHIPAPWRKVQNGSMMSYNLLNLQGKDCHFFYQKIENKCHI